ncbi:SemiSWEET family transporter [Kineococcus sp. SYSU DK003]|uniref:SemiSWEET family transporter n=1 Tax=Kineococcus sp. SYSU DK003 TaxID=3383124 RepID=UPI003D7C6853
MPVTTLISVLGLAAAALGIVTGVPQILRLLKSTDASGLSYSSAVLGVLASGTWLTYGLLLLDPAQLVANVPGLGCAVVTVVLAAHRLGLRLSTAAVATAAWVPVVAGAFALGGVVLVGMVATAVSLVKMLPQVRTVLRREPLGGLSPATFFLTQVSATMWTVYGLATAQTSVVVCSAVSAVLAGVVLSRRCPPLAVARALHYGRLGVAGRLLVRPLYLARRAQLTLAA